MIFNNKDFQTPVPVAEFMASFLPENAGVVLEPTPGAGNLVRAASKKASVVITPVGDFWKLDQSSRFSHIIMNPPFTPIADGFRYLQACMRMSDSIIALLPWLLIINSSRRFSEIKQFGLKEVVSLPRKTFPNSRIQCCVVLMQKGYQNNTVLSVFEF